MLYQRDANRALALGRGLDIDIRGIISLTLDLMVLQNGAIPATPPEYICGMLGCASRRWTQRYYPALHSIKFLTKRKVNGISCYVFASPDDMTLTCPPAEHMGQRDHPASSVNSSDQYRTVREMIEDAKPIVSEPIMLVDEATEVVKEDWQSKPPLVTAAPAPAITPALADPIDQMTPRPSVMEVLQRAGIDVDTHPDGQLFWARSEHATILEEWLERTQLNEIVNNLSKAKDSGALPVHPNSLRHFTQYASPVVLR